MKKLGAYLLVLIIGALAGMIATKKILDLKHAAALHEADVQHQADELIIDTAKQVIADQTKEIDRLLADAGKPRPAELEKDKEIAALAASVAAYEAQGDLAGALAAAKKEISAWAEKFSLAEKRHQDSLSALNKAWQVKFDAQVDISATWEKAYYDQQKELDGLAADLAAATAGSSFERASQEIQGLGGGVYVAVRYKDPLPLAIYAGQKLVVKIRKLIGK